jgi:hypothetical protein
MRYGIRYLRPLSQPILSGHRDRIEQSGYGLFFQKATYELDAKSKHRHHFSRDEWLFFPGSSNIRPGRPDPHDLRKSPSAKVGGLEIPIKWAKTICLHLQNEKERRPRHR